MNEEMITRLVYAWRNAKEVSDGLENTFGMALDIVFDIHGNILDALREYVFEKGDVDNSEVLNLLMSSADAETVATVLCTQHDKEIEKNKTVHVTLGAPKFFTDEQIQRMQQVFGGYGGYTHDTK